MTDFIETDLSEYFDKWVVSSGASLKVLEQGKLPPNFGSVFPEEFEFMAQSKSRVTFIADFRQAIETFVSEYKLTPKTQVTRRFVTLRPTEGAVDGEMYKGVFLAMAVSVTHLPE